VVPALDIPHLPDSRLSVRLSRQPHRLIARRRRHSCRPPLHHTLPHLPTTLRHHQICMFRHPVLRTLRRHPATLQLPPTIVHLRLILLEPRCLQVLDYPQPVLSTAQAVRTSLRRALNTKEPSRLRSTLQHPLRTLLLVLNSHQRKPERNCYPNRKVRLTKISSPKN
jgi:hypothetical protein